MSISSINSINNVKVEAGNLENEVKRLNDQGYTVISSKLNENGFFLQYRATATVEEVVRKNPEPIIAKVEKEAKCFPEIFSKFRKSKN